jgi:hypothetical protein
MDICTYICHVASVTTQGGWGPVCRITPKFLSTYLQTSYPSLRDWSPMAFTFLFFKIDVTWKFREKDIFIENGILLKRKHCLFDFYKYCLRYLIFIRFYKRITPHNRDHPSILGFSWSSETGEEGRMGRKVPAANISKTIQGITMILVQVQDELKLLVPRLHVVRSLWHYYWPNFPISVIWRKISDIFC